MQATPDLVAIARRHLRFGWWTLLLFLAMGLVLETLHGFKLGWYVDAGHETRRLLLTLAHAHGTLLALIHLAFACCLRAFPDTDPRRCLTASHCLRSASVLLPGGFLLGGVVIYGGDPGLAVLAVPVGGLLLFAGVLLTALATTR